MSRQWNSTSVPWSQVWNYCYEIFVNVASCNEQLSSKHYVSFSYCKNLGSVSMENGWDFIFSIFGDILIALIFYCIPRNQQSTSPLKFLSNHINLIYTYVCTYVNVRVCIDMKRDFELQEYFLLIGVYSCAVQRIQRWWLKYRKKHFGQGFCIPVKSLINSFVESNEQGTKTFL